MRRGARRHELRIARSLDAGDHWTRFDPTTGTDGGSMLHRSLSRRTDVRLRGRGAPGVGHGGPDQDWRVLGMPPVFPGEQCPSLSRPRSRRSCSPRSGTRPSSTCWPHGMKCSMRPTSRSTRPSRSPGRSPGRSSWPGRRPHDDEYRGRQVPGPVRGDERPGRRLRPVAGPTDRCGGCRVLRTRPAMRHGSDHVEGELTDHLGGDGQGPRGLR